MNNRPLLLSLGACCAALVAASPAAACSSCGCNLTSDWLSQNLVSQPGTTIGLRYDDVPQTQLRSGRNAVDPGSIVLPADQEIEQHTYNNYLTLTVDHSFDPSWAIDVQLPLLWRPHDTIPEGETDISHSNTKGLGDMRLAVRYQGFGGSGITGVSLGVKLPTGAFDQSFASGSEAGEPVDRGLQPGTGTLDATFGVYHFGTLAGNFDYLLQAQGEVPLGSRDGYKPGIAGTFSGGINYSGWNGITPQLQFNLRMADKDSGINSDRDNSGGEQLNVALGLSARLGPHLSTFGIVQLPVYQRVNGLQLAPKYTLSFGLQYRV